MLELRDGEERANLVIALSRARAISGRVTDDAGNPLANVEIMLTTSRATGSGSQVRPAGPMTAGCFACTALPRGVTGSAPSRAAVSASIHNCSLRRLQYVQTCYPSATDASDATEVAVSDQDVSGIEIRMQRRPTYVLRGQVIGTDGGPPENARLSVTRIEKDGSSGTGTQLRPDGTFTVSTSRPGLTRSRLASGANATRIRRTIVSPSGARFESP